MRIRISARSSQLAQLQAVMVGEALKSKNPQVNIEYHFRESLGDKNLTDPLWKIPQKGVFTEDFYQDLIDEKTDMVVHSWKDLPTETKNDTEIVATLPRADQRDLLLIKKTSEKKRELRLFTSSPRRSYNLGRDLPSLLPSQPQQIEFCNVRGNVPTRLRKLFADESIDGLILAKAAVDRFLLSDWQELSDLQIEIRSLLAQLHLLVLPLSINPNAAAQGALAVEMKKNLIGEALQIKSLVASINHVNTYRAATLEREKLAAYGGGCHQKIGVAYLSRNDGDVIFLQGKTDAGEVLNSRTFKPRGVRTLPAQKLRWSSSTLNEQATTKDFGEVKLDLKSFDVIHVAKSSALTGTLQVEIRESNKILWCSGVETWKKLAARGFWVTGCDDGLGESTEDPLRALLAKSNLAWLKLTHEDALDQSAQDCPTRNNKVLATYQLDVSSSVSDKTIQEIQNAEIIFWRSAAHYTAVAAKWPEVKFKRHACGLGLTQNFLKKLVGSEPELFLNETDFLSQ